MARTAKPDRATPELRVCVEGFCFLGSDGSERTIMPGQRFRPDSEPVRRRPSSFIGLERGRRAHRGAARRMAQPAVTSAHPEPVAHRAAPAPLQAQRQAGGG